MASGFYEGGGPPGGPPEGFCSILPYPYAAHYVPGAMGGQEEIRTVFITGARAAAPPAGRKLGR